MTPDQTIAELRAEVESMQKIAGSLSLDVQSASGQVNVLTQKLAESEASCAAMRDFVTGCVGHYMALDHGEPIENLLGHILKDGGKAMDAATSGSELLERLERYEKALKNISTNETSSRSDIRELAHQALTAQQSEGTICQEHPKTGH